MRISKRSNQEISMKVRLVLGAVIFWSLCGRRVSVIVDEIEI